MFKSRYSWSSLVVVKDPRLSLLWLSFSPWPRNFPMLWALPKKKKKKKAKPICLKELIFIPGGC